MLRGKALCKDPLICSLPTVGTLSHLLQNDNLIFFGDLLYILSFLKLQDTGLWQMSEPEKQHVDVAYSVLTLTLGTTGLK